MRVGVITGADLRRLPLLTLAKIAEAAARDTDHGDDKRDLVEKALAAIRERSSCGRS
jgi:hypothetical protein